MATIAPEPFCLDSALPVEFWAAMPETKPAYELIAGELKRKKLKRQMDVQAISRLSFALFLWGGSRGWSFLTNFGLRADDYNGFAPDFMGLTPAPYPDISAVYVETAFLVADVIWGTTNSDRAAKMRGYARANVEIRLLIDAQAQTIEVYRLNGDIYGAPEVLAGNAIWSPPEFEGLQLDLSKLWV